MAYVMCYMVYISTNCPDDLSALSSHAVRFEQPKAENYTPCPAIFNSHKTLGCQTWYVGSATGCSCTFRQLCKESIELGFDIPQEWYPEDSEEIQATLLLYEILCDIVQRGFSLSLLDCWSGDEHLDPNPLEVSCSAIAADQFRLYEGYQFIFKP